MTAKRAGSPITPGRWERLGGAAICVEAVMVVAAGGALVVGWLAGWTSVSGSSVFLVAFSVAVAAALVAVARALSRGSRWPRGGAFTWQVLQSAVALGSTGSRWWLAAILIAPVPFALGGILSGALRTQREGRDRAA